MCMSGKDLVNIPYVSLANINCATWLSIVGGIIYSIAVLTHAVCGHSIYFVAILTGFMSQ